MRISTAIAVAAGLCALGATASVADGHAAHGPKIYPYHTSANYCPEGLQPVTISGVICCGTPNQKHSYQAMMSHPVKKVAKKKKVHRTASKDCPVGTKGCTFN